MASWFNKIAPKNELRTVTAVKPAPGEIKSLQLQIDLLKNKKQFIPKQIDQLRLELNDITRQIKSLETQLTYLRNQN